MMGKNLQLGVLGMIILVVSSALAACTTIAPAAAPAQVTDPIRLRLSVALTPQELLTYQTALDRVQAAHPEWEIILEQVPQQSAVEKRTTQLAASELPDVVRVAGLNAQRWIRQEAFLDLTPLVASSEFDLDDFYPGPLEQFRWNDRLWAIPDSATPDIVFYNKRMFDAAGLAYPDASWTLEDMREAALALTLDDQGRTPLDSDFDANSIVQWGWNGGLTNFWQRHMVRGLGGDFCANADCTIMEFTDPETVEAVEWWANLTSVDYATLYDPYGGSQTGVPGDPFIAGKAAMGYNGFFAVGQLNDSSIVDYDIVEPFLAVNGNRYTPLSTNGYVISAETRHPDAAWELVQALTETEFLRSTWGTPGHAVPARRAAADAVLNPERAPANQSAILAAMEYGEVFRPYTATAFEVFAKTSPLFVDAMRGVTPVPEALAEIERIANETLAATP